MTARKNLIHVYAKIDALKDEYIRLFRSIYGRDVSWIYMQSLGVEAMNGLVRGLKLKENSK